MFARHPRLAVDIAMGVVSQEEPTLDYTKGIKERLNVAYDLAVANANKSAVRYKAHYDKRIRGATVSVGDRVLVKNVSIRGKNKLANTWKEDVYSVVEQPNPEVPVFVVCKENNKKARRTLHRNLLLPVNFLPLETGPADEKMTVKKVAPKKDQVPVPRSSSSDSESDSDSDTRQERYLLRSRLNPAAQEFVPQVPDATPAADPIEPVEEQFEEPGEDIRLQLEVTDTEDDGESEADDEIPVVEEEDEAEPADPDEDEAEPVLPLRQPRRQRKAPSFYGNPVSHLVTHRGSTTLGREDRSKVLDILYRLTYDSS